MIHDLEISEHRIKITPCKELEGFVDEPIFIQDEDTDFFNIPHSIAVLPFILNIAPVVWRIGGVWEVEQLGKKAASSLERARDGIKSLYPEYSWEGKIIGKSDDANSVGDRKALLFSGGLDSTFSAISIIEKSPALITIFGGGDLQLDDLHAEQTVDKAARKFARSHSLERFAIRSNFTRALNGNVKSLCPDLKGASWYAAIQHGMGLSGVAAPVMYKNGIGELFISATHSIGHQGGWGSHPSLEGVLDWRAGKVNHFGYDHDRTQKILALKRLADEKGLAVPTIVVCTRRNREGNCLSCGKCLRTLANILVNDLEPREFGFEISKSDARAHLMSSVEARLVPSKNRAYAWNSISSHAREKLEGQSDPFLQWLADLRIKSKPSRHRRFRSLLGRLLDLLKR